MLTISDLQINACQDEQYSHDSINVDEINFKTDELIHAATENINVSKICEILPHHCFQFLFLS